MKKLFAFAFVLFLATSAQAQFLGQLSDARVQDQGRSLMGGYIGIYDGNVFSVFGQYRYGFAYAMDGGFKLGFVDASGGESGIGVEGDVRYQLLNQKAADPLDLSLGGGLEFYFGDAVSVFSFLFNGMVSHRFVSASGRGMTPYGRAQVRIERIGNGTSDTNGEFGVNAGGEVEFAQGISAVAELQLDSSELADFGLLFGLNYRF